MVLFRQKVDNFIEISGVPFHYNNYPRITRSNVFLCLNIQWFKAADVSTLSCPNATTFPISYVSKVHILRLICVTLTRSIQSNSLQKVVQAKGFVSVTIHFSNHKTLELTQFSFVLPITHYPLQEKQGSTIIIHNGIASYLLDHIFTYLSPS